MAKAFARHAKALEDEPMAASDTPFLPRAADGGEGSLGFGARGPRVKVLQRALTKKGYVLVADGLFGLVTERVVRQFQRDHMMAETGVVGTKEMARLGVFQPGLLERLGEHLTQARVAGSEASRRLRQRFRSGIKSSLLSISRRLE
ncbi:MAG: peptidoglycan-binding domain-containing protein [Pseudomonadota bacterium]